MRSVLSFYHDQVCGGHFSGRKTVAKVLQCGFYWPTLFRDAFECCKSCTRCQQLGRISRKDMMPLNPIIVVEVFDVWGVDFMGPFLSSFGNEYICQLWTMFLNALRPSLLGPMKLKVL